MRAKTLCSRPACPMVMPCQKHARKDTRPAWRPNGRPSYSQRHAPIPKAMRARVLAEEQGCAICGKPDDPTVDHKDNTLEEPARSERANLQRLCAPHNRAKSKREAIASRRQRVRVRRQGSANFAE